MTRKYPIAPSVRKNGMKIETDRGIFVVDRDNPNYIVIDYGNPNEEKVHGEFIKSEKEV